MRDKSAIEWTDSTWNPATGCTRVSAGCDNCYAAKLAATRLEAVYRRRLPVIDTEANRADPFAVRLWPERLTQPQKWLDPRMVFVNSMSDLFHKDVPDVYVRRVFEAMLATDRHVYQVLTKRPGRVLRFFRKHADLLHRGQLPQHIWIGTSVEDQSVVHRVHQLRQAPARTRFVSCEPLLGPLKLPLDGLHWVIAGGESGPGYRKPEPRWFEELRDQCVARGVPFFFKQWGGRTSKSGGRLLDGREWNEFPRPTKKKVKREKRMSAV